MNDQDVWLEAVVKSFNRKQLLTKVISVEEQVLVGAGENYLSQVKRLVVRAVRADGEIVTKSFILKVLPTGARTREMCLEVGFNFTEFTTYRDVLSSMDLIMQERGIPDEPLWAECIAMKPYGTILFDDLTARGYKMADRIKGLDMEHCTLVAQNLGLFHAMSLVLKERGKLSKLVYGKHAILREGEDFANLVDFGYKKLLRHMEEWGQEWRHSLEKMKAKLPDFAKIIFDLLGNSSEDEFTVLNHGDTWTNNMLFKYNVYSGKPLFMRFLDFQVSFLGSPAYDLTYFLISSPNLDVRRHHQKELIRIYYDSLLFNMGRLSVTEKPPSYDYIESEMKRLTYMRFYLMTTLLTMITRKPEDPVDLEGLLKEGEKLGSDKSPNMDAWMAHVDDNLRAVYEITIKQAEDEGTL